MMGITSGSGPSRYCVIGAGAAGLTTCRALLQHGVTFECLECEDDVGGIFNYGKRHSSIYQSVHLLSSKKTTEYPDFPMPARYPHYPHHRLVLEYFRADQLGGAWDPHALPADALPIRRAG